MMKKINKVREVQMRGGDMRRTFGERVIIYLHRHKMTVAQFSKASGIGKKAIDHIINDRFGSYTFGQLIKVFGALGYEFEMGLITREEAKKKYGNRMIK